MYVSPYTSPVCLFDMHLTSTSYGRWRSTFICTTMACTICTVLPILAAWMYVRVSSEPKLPDARVL